MAIPILYLPTGLPVHSACHTLLTLNAMAPPKHFVAERSISRWRFSGSERTALQRLLNRRLEILVAAHSGVHDLSGAIHNHDVRGSWSVVGFGCVAFRVKDNL